jgi:hypothetical protein
VFRCREIPGQHSLKRLPDRFRFACRHRVAWSPAADAAGDHYAGEMIRALRLLVRCAAPWAS